MTEKKNRNRAFTQRYGASMSLLLIVILYHCHNYLASTFFELLGYRLHVYCVTATIVPQKMFFSASRVQNSVTGPCMTLGNDFSSLLLIGTSSIV